MISAAHSPEPASADASTKMAQALRHLQHAVTQSHDAVFFTDGAGIISRVNPAFEQVTGYSSLQAVGKDVSSFLAGGPQSEDYRRIWAKMFSHRPFSGEVSLQPKTGSPIPVEMVATPVLDNHGQITGLVCNFASRTGLSVAPQVTRVPASRGIEPEEALAHELINILLPVVANAELALESLPSDSPLRIRIRVVRSGARRAIDLVRSLLASSDETLLRQADLADMPAAVANSSHEASSEVPRQGPATLLVVEDENEIRESMVEFLRRSGYNVLCAASAEEALTEIRSQSSDIDLVITDVALPEMGGQRLAGKMASMHPEMKILFVSGHSQATLLQRDAPQLNRAFLQKPFSLPMLEEKILGVLSPPGKARAAAAAAG